MCVGEEDKIRGGRLEGNVGGRSVCVKSVGGGGRG